MADTDTLERASALVRGGEPLAGAAVCGTILAREPRNAVAAHLLGLALKDSGDWQQGEQWLRFSIQLEPNQGEFHANLGNLLRKWARYAEAEAAYRQALLRLPDHRAARRGLAQTLNDQERPADAEEQCRILLAGDAADADAWEILALALTQLRRASEAEAAHRRAIALDPHNAVAHHNLGALLVGMDRPDAMASLDAARQLGADGYELAYNRALAALITGDVEAAEPALARAAELEPLNVEAQRTLASVRFMRGDSAFARSLGQAVRANRDNAPLQSLLAELLWRAGELPGAETLLRDVLAREGSNVSARSTLAMVLMDQERLAEAEAEALEAAATRQGGPTVALNLVSVLLARGRAEEARPFISAQLQREPLSQEWLAHEATAARMLNQERYRELYAYERFAYPFDLEPPPGFESMGELNRRLAAALSERHRIGQQPLDPVLRRWSRTSRILLSDPDTAVRGALDAFERAIEEYRRTLELSHDHPLARIRAGGTRITAAWPVRLQRHGFEVNHVDSEGAVTGIYYVEVPDEARDPGLRSGWLKLGEPRHAAAGLGPERFIEPRPGRLVLFPSYMWHGTNRIYGEAPCTYISFTLV